jgi:hypothetical protein
MSSNYDEIRKEIIKRRGESTDHLDIYWEQYSDKTHFIYELLQNAEDARARKISFVLKNFELSVLHNGRIFTENDTIKDVTGICDIKKTTKSDDLTQIGKLGMGFKAVYAYTDIPKVFSGEEHFRIEKLIRPHYEESQLIPDSFTTLFILPFKRELAKEAYANIRERLSDIGIRTMLFLQYIKEIDFEIYDGVDKIKTGCYLREPEVAYNDMQTTKLVGEIRKNDESESVQSYEEDWLIFLEKIPLESDLGEDHPKVGVAFLFDTKNGKKYIKRAQDTYLNVFFPSHEKTGLGFILQGPYKTTPNRSEIPPKDPWNIKLIELTKDLISKSLVAMTKDRIIEPSRQLITTLRVNQDSIRDEMRSLFDIIIAGVLNDLKMLPLLPADDDTFISAKHTRLPETSDVRKLLQDCLSEYLDITDPVKWISKDITADSEDTRSIFDFLQKELGVDIIRYDSRYDSMCRKITEPTSVFLKNRVNDIDWFIDFYKSLNGKVSLKKPRGNHDYDYGWMRIRNFILTSNNEIIPPFNSDDSNNVFLPLGDSTNEKTIHTELLKDKEIVEFFEWLKITTPDFLDIIERDIFPKYISDTDISLEENIVDIKQILRGITNTDSEENKEIFIKKLSQISFLIGVSEDYSRRYCKPSELFLDSILENPSGLSEFSDILGKWEVAPEYKGRFSNVEYIDFLKKQLRIICRLPIYKTSARENQLVKRGGLERSDTRISEDYYIKDIDKYLEKNKIKASLIIWNAIINVPSDITSARYRANASCDIQTVKSNIVQYLESHEWILTKNGEFKRPEDVIQGDLLQEFRFDESNGLLKAIGFGRKQEQETEVFQQKKEIAAEFGASIEEFNEFKNILKSTGLTFGDVIMKIKKTQVKSSHDFPSRTIQNHDRRIDAMAVKNANAEEKLYENRQRRVRMSSVSAGSKKTYLEYQYTNDENIMLCQICKREMPFKKRSGDYYYEAVEVLSNTYLPRENEEQYLALCPECSARYNEYVLHDDSIMDELKNHILNGTEINLKLGDISENDHEPFVTNIYFEGSHLLDLQTILRKKNNG